MSTIPSRLVRSARHGWRLARIEAEVTNRSSFVHCRYFASGSKKSGEDHHAFFQEQLLELEKERKSFFGDDVDQEDTSTKMDAQEQHAFFAQEMEELNQQRSDFFGESTPNASFDTNTSNTPSLNDTSVKARSSSEEDLDEIHRQRDAIFQFSDDEKKAWSQQGAVGKRISPQLMMEIAEARAAKERGETYTPKGGDSHENDLHHPSFSHVSQDGDSVHMVDVGHKEVTTRMAEAQTKVILPDSVMEAFGLQGDNSHEQQNELIGPKGPILATAKLAGIMAAKKTSDLIPLCHPLPLDQVKLDIRLVQNEVLINCICRVTHKTGVEMEALTGASVAALTVYDMVKAVSHEVEITDTKLVAKTGGKRTIRKD